MYVNPVRMGGGFSVIEAFWQGKPGVYLPVGDVYIAGGEEFAVSDLETMKKRIKEYKEDASYYKEMSYKAKERSRLMTSSLEAMKNLDSEIIERVRRKYW